MAINLSSRQGRIFKFHSEAVAEETFHVVTVDGRESISRPYHMEINLTTKKKDLDFDRILSEPAYLGMKLGVTLRGGSRGIQSKRIHGMITEIEECESQAEWTVYRVVLVPRVWKLYHNVRTRIFQGKTVIDIIRDILKENGFAEGESDFEFRTSDERYPKLDYVVQYAESEFEFLSRLMEHAGISYFFLQEEECEKIIFGDSTGAFEPLPGDQELDFVPVTGRSHGDSFDLLEKDTVFRVSRLHRQVQDEVLLRDYNHRTPDIDLSASEKAQKNDKGLHHLHGEHYKTQKEGTELAKVRLEEIQWQKKVYRGTSFCRAFRAGYVYALDKHPGKDFNQKYTLTEVRHRGEQTIPMGAGAMLHSSYENEFVSIPADIPFRPRRVTRKPKVTGTLNAIVDAAGSGDYAELNEQGEYKVRFALDPSDAGKAKASRYLRMAQPYLGAGYGMHFPLHAGTEVAVAHTNGDPDRPYIQAAVPNANSGTPVTGGNQSQCVLKSGGNNEIRFEDQSGGEQVYLHATKDWVTEVENDKTESVGNNNSESVGNDETISVKNNRAKTVDVDQSETIGNNKTIKVGVDHGETIGSNMTLDVGSNRTATIGANDTLTVAGMQTVTVTLAKSETVGMISSETVGLAKNLTIGASYGVTVAASMNVSVGASKSEKVGASKSETVGAGKTVSIGADLGETITGNHAESTKGNISMSGDKKIIIKAKEDIIIGNAKASITLTKSGDIEISGKEINIKGSGNVTVKGKKIAEN